MPPSALKSPYKTLNRQSRKRKEMSRTSRSHPVIQSPAPHSPSLISPALICLMSVAARWERKDGKNLPCGILRASSAHESWIDGCGVLHDCTLNTGHWQLLDLGETVAVCLPPCCASLGNVLRGRGELFGDGRGG
jgi:hypothetical protein